MKVQLFLNVKVYNSMVEYTSDICRVNSSNLFRPKTSVAKLVNALNLEFSFTKIRVQVSSEVD